MNLLVSDYDGTLNPSSLNKIVRSHFVLDMNIRYIKKLDLNSHFMLSTGRNYTSIKKEIDKYGIPYDYLSCNDGATLFNRDGQLIFSNHIDNDLVVRLINELKEIGINNLEFHDDMGKTNNSKDIIEIGFFADKNKLELVKSAIHKYDDISLMCFKGINFIETTGGKSRTINRLNDIIKYDNIYTIGDSNNDIEMLTEFNGYKLFTCSTCLYFKGIKTTSSVKSLIKKIPIYTTK